MECDRDVEAEVQFIIAEDVDPNNWNVRFSMGKLHEKLGEKNLAIGCYCEVYQKATPESSVWKESQLKIKQLGGKIPELFEHPENLKRDKGSNTSQATNKIQDQDPVEVTTNNILSLPDKAFFLYLARILQRTVGQNALKSLEGNGPSLNVTQIIESLYREFEGYAGISGLQTYEQGIVKFDERIDQTNSFELKILTQWYYARTAIVKFQTADKHEHKPFEETKLEMLKACEMILVTSAMTFGWDYIPSALQSAWDLDTLLLLKEQSKLDQFMELGFDPFVHVVSDKKGLSRLRQVPSIDLGSNIHEKDTGLRELGQNLTKQKEWIQIEVPPFTGDAYVDDCFTINYQELPDSRDWFSIKQIKEAQHYQWSGDMNKALEVMSKLVSEYSDFDIVYSWSAQVYRRMGNFSKAIEILEEGLDKAKLKGGLCGDLGSLYFEELQDLKNAVKWWIRSCSIQLGGGKADLAFSFLNLSAVVNPFPSMDIQRQWLLNQADRIDNRRTRFNEKGLNDRHQMAINQGDQSMINAIRLLCSYYSHGKD